MDLQRDSLHTVAVLAAMGLAISCAGAPRHRPSSAVPAALTLAGESDFPPLPELSVLRSARFGGVSALAFDATTGDLLGLSDDSQNPRVFVFRVSGEDASFKVELRAYFPLPIAGDAGAAGAGGGQGAPVALDPEGLAVTRSGRLFVSSEGLIGRSPRVPPGIYEYSRHVAFVRSLELPEKFIPPSEEPITRGVRPNAAFESLTLTPDDRRLFTATESAIVQDGPAADFAHGAPSRIIEYEASGETYVPRRELAYYVDPVARPDFTAGFNINGLVELLAFSDTDLLSMERSYAEESPDGRRLNRIRIYRVSLEGATDISRIASLQGASNVRPARKTLVLDFADLRGLSPELQALDNFEGLTFGPRGPSGPTLITVSDDNFSLRQHTAFLLLRWTRMAGL